MKKIRILVVDDENVVREGIVTMLRLQPDMQVVGEGMDGIQAVALALKTKPDVVLLDLNMPKQNGLVTIPKLVEVLPEGRILVLTGFADHDMVYQAVKSGALGYIHPSSRPSR
jgi:DNA-binding NarL/FixJ family response regulator